jgi:hypothetical protein
MKEARGIRGKVKVTTGQDHSNRPVVRATQRTGFPTCVCTWKDMKFRNIGLAGFLIRITRDTKWTIQNTTSLRMNFAYSQSILRGGNEVLSAQHIHRAIHGKA